MILLPKNLYRGFATLDLIFSIIPIVLILNLVLSFVFLVRDNVDSSISESQTFDKLVAISNYLVRSKLIVSKDFYSIPNHLPSNSYDFSKLESELKTKFELKELKISFDSSDLPNGVCISRYIVIEADAQISSLYVCGG